MIPAFVARSRSLRASGGLRTGSTGAVGPVGRLRCDARVGVAPPNSLRSPAVRCPQTAAASQSRKRAARADPDAALLAAPHSPAHRPPLARGCWRAEGCQPGTARGGCRCICPLCRCGHRASVHLPHVTMPRLCEASDRNNGIPFRRRVGWGQVVAPVGLAEECRAVGLRAQRASSSDWPRLSERSEPQVNRHGAPTAAHCAAGPPRGMTKLGAARRFVMSSAAGPADRAPQGSRPGGPTETVGRRSLSPSDEKQRRICIAHSTVARII
jgi:hypothetical protein